jgi:hypothetical protein
MWNGFIWRFLGSLNSVHRLVFSGTQRFRSLSGSGFLNTVLKNTERWTKSKIYWIHLALEEVQWRALGNTAISNRRVS